MSTVKKQIYKRLNDLSLIISSNLREIDDVEFVKQVIEILPGTRVSIYSELFEDALHYYKLNKEWPDFDYVNMHFEDLMAELKDEEPAYHYSFQNEYLKLLQRDSTLRKLDKAIAEDDLEGVSSIIEADPLFTTNEDHLHTFLDLWDKYLEIKNSKPPLNWGIQEMNKMYRGLCYGTCNILSSPPGKFKTTTAISASYVNVREGKKVLYITLEDSWDVIYFNFAIRESYEQDRLLNASDVKIGQLDEVDEQTLKEIARDCAKKYNDNLRVACAETWSDFSPSGMLRLIRRAKQEMNGLDLVVLDHASLTKYFRVKGIADSKEVINYYLRFLTYWSIALPDKYAFLALLQTNRDGIKELEAGKTGSITNLAEANEAERIASTVTIVYSGPNAVESGVVQFFPKKNRRGRLSAKPIITFIEPSAYFVGEKAVDENLSLDDLMDDMAEDENKVKKTKQAVPVEHSEEPVKKPKKLNNSNSENNSDKSPSNSTSIKKRKIRKLNKNVVHV